MRGRTICEGRTAGTLYQVEPNGLYPAAETPHEAAACEISNRIQFGREIPETLEVWNTDGIIGCQLLWNPQTINSRDPRVISVVRQLQS